eukprot:1105070-Pleurochrysis_carterae.AAC.2
MCLAFEIGLLSFIVQAVDVDMVTSEALAWCMALDTRMGSAGSKCHLVLTAVLTMLRRASSFSLSCYEHTLSFSCRASVEFCDDSSDFWRHFFDFFCATSVV